MTDETDDRIAPTDPLLRLAPLPPHTSTPNNSDRVTRENLEFFLAVAVGQDADPWTDYVIAVNGPSSVPLDALPANVRVVRRENVCYDGGTAGEVLAGMDVQPYRFFIVMNSSVRGPFLPAYFAGSNGGGGEVDEGGEEEGRRRRPWTTALTDLLNERVKLAGTTISCEIRVHVQSMVLATDRVGLEVLWKAGTFDCARDREDAIRRYELGASATIMANGYSVDCLMLRYRGVDWLAEAQRGQDQGANACNAGRNPFVSLNNDGMDINPLEVLFVKVKPHTLASDHALQRWTAYALGRDGDGDAGIARSHSHSPAVQRLLQGRRHRLERAVADCRASFDHDGFAAMYAGLARGRSPQATYADFLQEHLFAGHAFRYAVAERRAEQLPFQYCRPFLQYGAPDLSS